MSRYLSETDSLSLEVGSCTKPSRIDVEGMVTTRREP